MTNDNEIEAEMRRHLRKLEMNADTIKSEVKTLLRSEAGRAAAKNLLALLDGPPLDHRNQEAYIVLSELAWSHGLHGSVTDELREALGISD